MKLILNQVKYDIKTSNIYLREYLPELEVNYLSKYIVYMNAVQALIVLSLQPHIHSCTEI